MRALILAPVIVALVAGPAAATPERCLLEVGGKPYLLGRCNVDREPNGSFSVGTGDARTGSPFFAYVSKNDDGIAVGSWNETPGSTHAHSELGTLKQRGACWVNDKAMVCAWR